MMALMKYTGIGLSITGACILLDRVQSKIKCRNLHEPKNKEEQTTEEKVDHYVKNYGNLSSSELCDLIELNYLMYRPSNQQLSNKERYLWTVINVDCEKSGVDDYSSRDIIVAA